MLFLPTILLLSREISMNAILDKLVTQLEWVLGKVGDLINQIPSPDEIKKTMKTPAPIPSYRKKDKFASSRSKNKLKKEINVHKGSAYGGKGRINTDTKTFNKPRKGTTPGRKH